MTSSNSASSVLLVLRYLALSSEHSEKYTVGELNLTFIQQCDWVHKLSSQENWQNSYVKSMQNPTELLPSEASKEKHRRTNIQVRAVSILVLLWVFIHPMQNEYICIVGDTDTFHITPEKERERAQGPGEWPWLCSCPPVVSVRMLLSGEDQC